MGIEYDLVSDEKREGYRLGKGPWGDEEFADALRSATPVESVREFLIAGMGWGKFEPKDAEEIARELAHFVATHADWRIVNDACDDIDVVDDEDRAELIAEGHDPDDKFFPMYKKVGSRYRAPKEGLAADPDLDLTALKGNASSVLIAASAAANRPFRPRIGVFLTYEADLKPGEALELLPEAKRSNGDRIDFATLVAFRAHELVVRSGREAILRRVFIRKEGLEEDQLAGGAEILLVVFAGYRRIDLSSVVPPAQLIFTVWNPTNEIVHIVIDVSGEAIV